MNVNKTTNRLFALTISALVLLVLPFGVSAHQRENNDEATKTVTLKVNDFNAIELKAPAIVHLYQSNEFRVELKGTETQIEHVSVSVDGKELEIKKKNWRPFDTDDTKYYPEISVYMPQFKKLDVNRGGRINVESPFSSREMAIEASSAGHIEAPHSLKAESIEIEASSASSIILGNLQAEQADVEASSAANVKLAAQALASELNASLSSAAHLRASNWECKRGNVKASTAAGVSVNVTELLTGKASLGATVMLYGKGQNELTTSSGASSIRRRN